METELEKLEGVQLRIGLLIKSILNLISNLMIINKDNALGLRQGSHGRILELNEGKTVFLPTLRKLSNARILTVNEDGSILVHWKDNYNLDGDFRTELMLFNQDLILDLEDTESRNKLRKEHGLVPVKY